MNKSFKNKSQIALDDKHFLIPDSDSGIILVFHEIRQRKKKDSEELEDYEFTDRWYFTRIVQSLRKYTELTENSCKTIDEILEKVKYNTELLDRLDVEFKQF